MGKIAVDMQNITVRFGSFTANDGVNLSVPEGTAHALLGENGAGKSTLMNVLYGLIQPEAGEIYLKGQKVRLETPARAIEHGVGMVHQHFMLVPPFTVAENIVLGSEPSLFAGVLNRKKARREVEELAKRYDLLVDPDARVEDISVGMQQRTEILKVLYRGADILILDEPTAALTPQEIEELGLIIKSLRENGKTIIIITHKLAEIKAMASQCTIIRAGKVVDSVQVAATSEEKLAALMVGRAVSFAVPKERAQQGEPLLRVENLVVRDYRGRNAINDLSLVVRAGEIVGIAGVDGNGQSELAAALTGLKKALSGKIFVNGRDVLNRSPRAIFTGGLSSIPEDRHKHALVLDFKVAENAVLQNIRQKGFSKRGFLQKRAIHKHAQELIERFDIRPNHCIDLKTRSLSGGNQQKLVIAREVANNKDVLVCVNPTRGLDVGAIEYVHRYIVAQRDSGKAILLISFELTEIMHLSDRIDVLFQGKISGSLLASQADQTTLGLLMAGGKV